MKAIHWIIAAAALAFAGPVQAGVSDPEVIVYRFPGVLDSGGADNTGTTTSFHCTNFSGVTENIRIVIRDAIGGLKVNFPFAISHLATLSLSTKGTVLYAQTTLGTRSGTQVTAAIAATSINIICTAVTLDAASASPVGFALRGIRFNSAPGSQE